MLWSPALSMGGVGTWCMGTHNVPTYILYLGLLTNINKNYTLANISTLYVPTHHVPTTGRHWTVGSWIQGWTISGTKCLREGWVGKCSESY